MKNSVSQQNLMRKSPKKLNKLFKMASSEKLASERINEINLKRRQQVARQHFHAQTESRFRQLFKGKSLPHEFSILQEPSMVFENSKQNYSFQRTLS